MSTLELRQRLVEIARRDVGKVEISHNRAPWVQKLWSATDIPNGHQLRYPYCSAGMAYCMREWLRDRDVLAQLKLTTRFVEQGAEAQALARVAHALTVGAAGTYRFHLADDKLVNAFALPGGDIVVNRGLIAATHDAGELAGVLAHEIQHVALRHSLKGMIRSAGMSLLFSMLIGDLGTTLVGQAAENLAGLKFSRDAESEADAEGFNLLVARGIDPRGMVRFFATLAGESGATPPALLSTHPASAEREAALAVRLAALPPDCCKPILTPGAWPPRP